MSWPIIFIAAVIALLILRKVVRAFVRLVVDLLLILAGLTLLLAVLPPDILSRIYSFLPRGLAEILRAILPALRGKLPLPY